MAPAWAALYAAAVVLNCLLFVSHAQGGPCPGSTTLQENTPSTLPINGTLLTLFDITPGAADTAISLSITWNSSASAAVFAAPWCSPNPLSFAFANSSSSAASLSLIFPIAAPSSIWQFAFSFSSVSPPATVVATLMSLAACPNSCSGHGTCGAGVCLCNSPYNGVSDDCSIFSLAYGAVVEDEMGAAGVVGALPAPTGIEAGSTVFTVFINATLPTGGLLLVASGRIPILSSYDISFNDSEAATAVYAPLVTNLILYFTLLPPPGASSPLPFSISVSTFWLCPNNCSGHGACESLGCVCDPGYTTVIDCSLFDLVVASNLSAPALVPANTWIYFNLGVTDATQLEWDVYTVTDACATSPTALQVYARQNSRPTGTAYDYRSYGVGADRRLDISLGGPRAGEPSVWWLGLSSTIDCQVLVTGIATRMCPNDCSDNGLCQAGTCVCVPPFTLDDCSATDVELYADMPVSVSVGADQLAFFHTQVLGDDALYIRAEELDTQGSVILLVRLGSYPSASQFTYRNASTSSLHEILVPSTDTTGIWYVALLGAASLAPPQPMASVHLLVSEGCSAYLTCAPCIADLNCGWCSSDPLNSVRGACVSGNDQEPYSATCEAWLFDTCSTGALRRHTTFLGLLLGIGLGSLLILAVAAVAFVIYRYWHRSFKQALSVRQNSDGNLLQGSQN